MLLNVPPCFKPEMLSMSSSGTISWFFWPISTAPCDFKPSHIVPPAAHRIKAAHGNGISKPLRYQACCCGGARTGCCCCGRGAAAASGLGGGSFGCGSGTFRAAATAAAAAAGAATAPVTQLGSGRDAGSGGGAAAAAAGRGTAALLAAAAQVNTKLTSGAATRRITASGSVAGLLRRS
ncbi:hypothetical protein TSOC_002111 [Tetrabaena socialis]|uniref:Uncharacterized protein n=1 Tax=Tetrabaena socialis TaxID=47790 RepID=A0A2J8AF11_9CHLO|nr:hypothetical protein TSOC_002111 [Tetrabaena socialis]|eukprot:PNH11113.1 hypothetical protein TSOC_002111 [Tetrabaena socialis]